MKKNNSKKIKSVFWRVIIVIVILFALGSIMRQQCLLFDKEMEILAKRRIIIKIKIRQGLSVSLRMDEYLAKKKELEQLLINNREKIPSDLNIETFVKQIQNISHKYGVNLFHYTVIKDTIDRDNFRATTIQLEFSGTKKDIKTLKDNLSKIRRTAFWENECATHYKKIPLSPLGIVLSLHTTIYTFPLKCPFTNQVNYSLKYDREKDLRKIWLCPFKAKIQRDVEEYMADIAEVKKYRTALTLLENIRYLNDGLKVTSDTTDYYSGHIAP